jgi:hypothetical protein
MSLVATMHIYSGRQNPRRLLSADETREFWDRLRSLQVQTIFKAVGFQSLVGYRGFTITDALRVRVRDGIVDLGSGRSSFWDRDRSLESWLLGTVFRGAIEPAALATAEESLSEDIDDIIKRRLSEWAFSRASATCISKAQDAPLYDPSRWNVDPFQDENSCYNYANDQRLHQVAEPGVGGGIKINFSCGGLLAGAKADHLHFVNDAKTALGPGQGWYVALATTPRLDDFHFYRQDSSGCWSHKVGLGEATNIDDDRKVITDPEVAKLGDYTFCAYMVTNRKVVIG